eukprot:TRINITY_DN1141_c0_g1_i1.p1 TRINITY_DN1141_c0_g1~~TRINITY_DN1141_c0_g1_i1.p1  ORF type:complete len:265 (+),score=93.70 TRINITY_DN1141_c0_g1_i1:53-796(+)
MAQKLVFGLFPPEDVAPKRSLAYSDDYLAKHFMTVNRIRSRADVAAAYGVAQWPEGGVIQLDNDMFAKLTEKLTLQITQKTAQAAQAAKQLVAEDEVQRQVQMKEDEVRRLLQAKDREHQRSLQQQKQDIHAFYKNRFPATPIDPVVEFEKSQEALRVIREKHTKEMAESDQQHAKAMDRLEKEHAKVMDNLEKDRATAEKEHAKVMDNLEKEHARLVENLEQEKLKTEELKTKLANAKAKLRLHAR